MYYYDWQTLFSGTGAAVLVALFAIWLGAAAGLSAIPAVSARKKGYSFAGFYCLSFFVSFVIALIIISALPSKNPAPVYGYAGMPPYGSTPPYGGPYFRR